MNSGSSSLITMTLEDFFTLTEMKNGLTTPARVEELMMCMMQKQDCATGTVGDAARQWLTVASTLASTENKECLNHFVYLNGLYFLNQWLLEALKCSQGASNDEELIHVLLESLEKLPMHRERFTASGILVSVEKLFVYKVANIKEKAKTLFKRWNSERFNDDACNEMYKDSSDLGNNSKPSPDAASIEDKHGAGQSFDSSCKTGVEEGSCRLEVGTNEKLLAKNYKNLRSDPADDVFEGPTTYQTMTDEEKCVLPPSHTSASDPCLKELPIEESSFVVLEMPSVSESVSLKAQVKCDDECSTSAVQYDHINAEMNTDKDVSYKSGERESLAVLSSTDPAASSPAKNSIVVSSASCNLEAKEHEFVILGAMENSSRCASLYRRKANYSRTLEEFKYGEHVAKELWDLLSNGRLLKSEAIESATEVKKLCNEPTLKACINVDAFNFGDPYKMSNATLTEDLDKKSDLELESEEFDALEIARRVAIEVEREVVDYREQSCSSSPEASSSNIVSTVSPDIAENNQDGHITEPNGVGSVIGKDYSDTAASPKNDFSRFSEVATDPGKKKQSLESPNQTADVHGFSGRTENSKCDFDLNADFCSEDLVCATIPTPNDPANLSSPISVSASKGVPELPITTLHFEGQLGWRGSAATSAFRPASPRKALDSVKTNLGSNVKTNLGSKRKGNFIEIDLNVTESESDVVVLPALCKEIPFPYGIPSRDSSVEVSSGRAEKIQLDLNSVEEEAPSLQSSILMGHHPQKGSCIQSPTCSSSSRQHSVRDFDLNENLYAFDAFGSQNGIISKYSSSVKVNDPGITIVSSKMAVERRDHTIQTQQAYMGSGLNWNAVMMGRPLIPYGHQVPTPGYGYNGLGMGSAITFQPALFSTGNIPRILDSRSITLMPQVSGSHGVNGAPLSTQPFLMSMASRPLSSNSVGQSHTCLDMNSGMMSMGNGSREVGNVKHLFMPGHSNFLEEQRKTASQQSTSAFPLKRKEPDSGLEPYGFGYNQLASWH